ncbi:MAG: 4-hydroxy-3-methylbut-2-enyl diphosphate reductase [Thermodesulfobacteriota bacterium]
MKIVVAKTAGFCMGVRRAVEMSLDASNNTSEPICSYGPLIHNPQVLRLLEEKGIFVVDRIPEKGNGTILIRAHGVPPETKETLTRAGFTVIDATCPRVIKVQTIIRKHAVRGFAVIIIGDRDHPEVVGLLGYAGEKGHVVDSLEALNALPVFEQAIIVAQTTQNTKFFEQVKDWAARRHPQYRIFNTICDSTDKRQAEVDRLSQTVDAMIVVGGYNSGNTQRLAEVARETGKPAYHIETEEDIDPKCLASIRSVGITAGASTPNWIINRVFRRVESLAFEKERRRRRMLYPLQRLLLFSNLYIALGAGSLTYTATQLQNMGEQLLPLLIACLYILSMHTFNHLTGRQSDRYNDPDRAAFYEDHHVALTLMAAAAGAAGLAIGFTMGPLPFFVLLAMSVLGGLYNVRIWSGWRSTRAFRSIKDIPGSKTVLIVLAWGIVTALLPALSISGRMYPATVFALVWSAGMVFIRTAFFDILDMQGDRIVGRETIPLFLGEERTRTLLKYTAMGLAVILCAAVGLGFISSLGIVLGMIPAVMFGIILAHERGALAGGIRLAFLVESTFVLAGLLTLIWAAA